MGTICKDFRLRRDPKIASTETKCKPSKNSHEIKSKRTFNKREDSGKPDEPIWEWNSREPGCYQ